MATEPVVTSLKDCEDPVAQAHGGVGREHRQPRQSPLGHPQPARVRLLLRHPLDVGVGGFALVRDLVQVAAAQAMLAEQEHLERDADLL